VLPTFSTFGPGFRGNVYQHYRFISTSFLVLQFPAVGYSLVFVIKARDFLCIANISSCMVATGFSGCPIFYTALRKMGT
jgi:hypothetical protein